LKVSEAEELKWQQMYSPEKCEKKRGGSSYRASKSGTRNPSSLVSKEGSVERHNESVDSGQAKSKLFNMFQTKLAPIQTGGDDANGPKES